MNKFFLTIFSIFVVLGFAWLITNQSKAPVVSEKQQTPISTKDVPFKIEEFVHGLVIPWSMVFTSPDRMLITERPGRLRVIENRKLLENPLHTFSEVVTGGEEGLMSIALDPDYSRNRLLYVSLAYMDAKNMYVEVLRFRDDGDSLSDRRVIIDQIPAAMYHAGSALAFGPDGKLYITTGDATNKDLPQNLKSLGGKILRLNSDGSIPSDNPFPGSPVWSYGHRNPQGIAWRGSEMYSSEHGPSTFDGPPGGDEVNRIIKGGNYGWPLVSHLKTKEGTVSPLKVFTPAEAPGSLMIYSGRLFPQFQNNIFFGALVGSGLMRLTLDEKNPDTIVSAAKLPEVKFGRIRNVIEGPDGLIYFTTSNRDGRGKPTATDDRIFRIVPTELSQR